MSASAFSKDDLERLFIKFRKLDKDKSGTLSVQEFMAIPQLANNPLVRRAVETFDKNHNGEVDFMEFIAALTLFTGSTAPTDWIKKIEFLFNLYDIDRDGFISCKDLYYMIQSMIGANLNEIQLQQLVDRTIRRFDHDYDGKLSYEEFQEAVKDAKVEHKLQIKVSFHSNEQDRNTNSHNKVPSVMQQDTSDMHSKKSLSSTDSSNNESHFVKPSNSQPQQTVRGKPLQNTSTSYQAEHALQQSLYSNKPSSEEYIQSQYTTSQSGSSTSASKVSKSIPKNMTQQQYYQYTQQQQQLQQQQLQQQQYQHNRQSQRSRNFTQ